jgi:hypothetical protein
MDALLTDSKLACHSQAAYRRDRAMSKTRDRPCMA